MTNVNNSEMTESQISEKLLKLTTDNDNVQSVVGESPFSGDSPENVEKTVDSSENADSSEKTNNCITWYGMILYTEDELKFAEEEFKHNKDNNFTDKQAIDTTKTAIKNIRKDKAKKLREEIKREKEEKAIAKENEKRFKELEETKAINYRIQHYENLGLEVNKNGYPTQNAGNYKALLLNKDVVPHTFKFNEFSESIEIDGRLLKDIDIVLISNQFSDIAGFENNTKLQNAIKEIAHNNTYHPVKQYLESLEWDGIPRVETMFTTFLSAKDCELYHVYAKLFMIAAIKRVYKPGCKFDNMLVLHGEQDNGKSAF